MAYSANQTKISYKVGTGTFAPIPYLMEVPEFGGAPEKIDVTTLSDNVKKFLPGIKDLGDLVFKFLYDNSSETANYRVFKQLEDDYNAAAVKDDSVVPVFQITYPDNTSHEFKAVPCAKMDAGAINGALTFSVTMVLLDDIAVTNPTA